MIVSFSKIFSLIFRQILHFGYLKLGATYADMFISSYATLDYRLDPLDIAATIFL